MPVRAFALGCARAVVFPRRAASPFPCLSAASRSKRNRNYSAPGGKPPFRPLRPLGAAGFAGSRLGRRFAAPPLFRARVFGGWRFVSGTASRPVEPAAPTLRRRPALPAWVVPLQSAQGAAVCCGGAVALRCSWPAAASLAPKALRATRCSPYCRHCPSLPMGNNWALTPVKFVPISLNSCLNARRALVGCAPSLAQIPPRRFAPVGVFR